MRKIKLGFTGTRKGMTQKQKNTFVDRILDLMPDEFHHGCCIGSDEEAHDLIRSYLPDCEIVGHPPTNESKVAKVICNRRNKPYPYLVRNKHIVKATEYMIGTPNGSIKRHRGSGTWHAIGLARKAESKLTIIYPDGQILTCHD